ncbi:MAG: hypothetical protein CVV11_15940 [Gammaproteobacteria bacterium HGW-Gammaproteobacteria-15]|nr:MAG: hypothetical protein CVV11_15940 [Gammaproteobacteria bacterium HGW-Gammaproteobacteria-15]
MALEICITTNPITREFIPCPVGHTLDEQSIPAAPLLPAGTPYITKSDKASGNDSDALRLFEMLKQLPPSDRRNIARLNKDFGTEVMDALAEFYQLQLKPALLTANNFLKTPAGKLLFKETPGTIGAMATVLEKRLTGLSGKIASYQLALEQYRTAYLNKTPAAERKALAKQVAEKQANVNRHFQGEIKRIIATNTAKSSSRGTVWSNPERAMGLARGSKTDSAIKLQSSHNFKRVQQFQRVAKVVGKNLIAFDAGTRILNVYGVKHDGGDWQKELAREMTGLGIGVIAGSIIGGEVAAALTLMLIATPYGWVLAIGAGVIAGVIAGVQGDLFGKYLADKAYEKSSALTR